MLVLLWSSLGLRSVILPHWCDVLSVPGTAISCNVPVNSAMTLQSSINHQLRSLFCHRAAQPDRLTEGRSWGRAGRKWAEPGRPLSSLCVWEGQPANKGREATKRAVLTARLPTRGGCRCDPTERHCLKLPRRRLLRHVTIFSDPAALTPAEELRANSTDIDGHADEFGQLWPEAGNP